MNALDLYRQCLETNRSGKGGCVASICSAHPLVLRALFRSALKYDSVALVESTSNQVDQYGGYTGMTPKDFVSLVHELADLEGFPKDRILLGGDHLGPNSWRAEGAENAMAKTLTLVEAYVKAGYRKIHLDASFVCAGDPTPLRDEIVAERAAQMAKVAEAAAADVRPVYIIGTEVPTPGGAMDDEDLHLTMPEEARATIEAFHKAFIKHGLEEAWERVTGLVVQPGVEFSDGHVLNYDGADALSKTILDYPGMVFEAHSTDYQTPDNLQRLVNDHFGILKVGPWLTWALREGLMALELIEQEMEPSEPSQFRAVLMTEMEQDPQYWQSYYTGSEQERAYKRLYSYSDRARYYLPREAVKQSIKRLEKNLGAGIPDGLLSMHMPEEYSAVRTGALTPKPEDLLMARISRVIDCYLTA